MRRSSKTLVQINFTKNDDCKTTFEVLYSETCEKALDAVQTAFDLFETKVCAARQREFEGTGISTSLLVEKMYAERSSSVFHREMGMIGTRLTLSSRSIDTQSLLSELSAIPGVSTLEIGLQRRVSLSQS